MCLAGADRIPEAPVQAAPEGRGVGGWGVFTGRGRESLPLRRQVWPPVDWSGLCVPAQQSWVGVPVCPFSLSCFLPPKQRPLSSPPGCLVEITGGWARGSDWLIKMYQGESRKATLQHKALMTEGEEGLLEIVETSQGPDGKNEDCPTGVKPLRVLQGLRVSPRTTYQYLA